MRTMTVHVCVNAAVAGEVAGALERAGFALSADDYRNDPNVPNGMSVVGIEALGDYSDGEQQREVIDAAYEVLDGAGIEFEPHSTGLVVQGGSVNHRWVPVLLNGEPIGMKTMYGPGEDVNSALAIIAEQLGVAPGELAIEVPDDLPPNS